MRIKKSIIKKLLIPLFFKYNLFIHKLSVRNYGVIRIRVINSVPDLDTDIYQKKEILNQIVTRYVRLDL